MQAAASRYPTELLTWLLLLLLLSWQAFRVSDLVSV